MRKEHREYLERYRSYLSNVRSFSDRTVQTYTYHVQQFLGYLEGLPVELEDARESDARQWIYSMMGAYEKSSINLILSSLKSFYRYLIRYERFERNIFSSIEGNPRQRKLPRYLTREEIIRLLSIETVTLTALRDSLMFHLFYSTGCRLSEILAMNYRDVDRDQARILVTGKGRRRRFVFLNPGTLRLLDEHRGKREAWCQRYPIREDADRDAILLGVQGKRLSPSSCHSIFEKYRVELQLEGVLTPHMIRHSFATHLLDNDSGIQLVRELLGHSSLSTTQIYTHVSGRRLRDVYRAAHPHGRKR